MRDSCRRPSGSRRMTGSDQLRQRVKYALSQMFVISSDQTSAVQSMPRGEANYYDVLGADAFGNFRQLLQDVTLSPMMGQFLSMQGNDKGNATTDPDENYAREVMQFFTIGLYQLNDDGSQKLDATGQPIPTYSNTDVMGLAAVFTGFSWNIPGDNSDTAWSNCCLYVGPGFGEESAADAEFPEPPLDCRKGISRSHNSGIGKPGPGRRPEDRSGHVVQSSESAGVLLKADDPAPGDKQSKSRLCRPGCSGVQRRRHRRARQSAGGDHGDSARPGSPRFGRATSAIRNMARCARRCCAIRSGRGHSPRNRALVPSTSAAPRIRSTGSARCGCDRLRSSIGLRPGMFLPAPASRRPAWWLRRCR